LLVRGVFPGNGTSGFFLIAMLIGLIPIARRAISAARASTPFSIEVLTSMCARLYGRRGARNRAMRAVTATKHGPGAA